MNIKRFSFFTILLGLFFTLTISNADRFNITKNNMKTIGSAINMYYEKHGKLPEANTIHQLKNLLTPGFIKECLVKDGWGRELFYFTRHSGDARGGDKGEYWLGSCGTNQRFDGFLCHMLKMKSTGENIIFSNGSFVALPGKDV